MTQNNLQEQDDMHVPESFISVVFNGYNSVDFLSFSLGKKVSPIQMLAVGKYLIVMAEREINNAFDKRDEIEQHNKIVAEQRNKIIVPGMDTDGLKL